MPVKKTVSKAKKPYKGKVVKIPRSLNNKPYGVKPEPFPRVLYTQCKYATTVLMVIGVANTATRSSYRLNSIFDPEVAGGVGSRTVVGHNILAQIYDQYWVMGAKVNLAFNDVSSDGCRVGYRLRINGNNDSNNQSVRELIEQPLTYLTGLNNTGSQSKVYNFYVKPWMLCGVSKLEYMANSERYSSQMMGSPASTQQCVFDVILNNTQVNNSAARYAMTITYYVKLYSRKTLISNGE